jgi:hypothetical protein
MRSLPLPLAGPRAPGSPAFRCVAPRPRYSPRHRRRRRRRPAPSRRPIRRHQSRPRSCWNRRWGGRLSWVESSARPIGCRSRYRPGASASIPVRSSQGRAAERAAGTCERPSSWAACRCGSGGRFRATWNRTRQPLPRREGYCRAWSQIRRADRGRQACHLRPTRWVLRMRPARHP